MSPAGRDFAKGSVVTLIPTGMGFILSGWVVGVVCLFVAGGLSLVLWTPLGRWLGFHDGSESESESSTATRPATWADIASMRVPVVDPASADSMRRAPVPHGGRVYGGGEIGAVLRQRQAQKEKEAVFEAVEGEIALAHEEALQMAKMLRAAGADQRVEAAVIRVKLPEWRTNLAEFIGAVLGAAQRAAFKGAEKGDNALECLESEAVFLSELAVNLTPESVRAGEAEILSATKTRRDNNPLSFLRHDGREGMSHAPQLSLGVVQMPNHSERIEVTDGVFKWGRILRVPVSNVQGAETAKAVQVQLTFCPDDTDGWRSPRDPAIAEWDTDPVVTTLDIPGNGQPQLFNVAFVLDEAFPYAFQWTRQSRRTGLDGYGIGGKGIVKVEARGAGPGSSAPSKTDTLHIEALNGSLTAMWESEGLGARRNGVPWRGIPMMGPPPGS